MKMETEMETASHQKDAASKRLGRHGLKGRYIGPTTALSSGRLSQPLFGEVVQGRLNP